MIIYLSYTTYANICWDVECCLWSNTCFKISLQNQQPFQAVDAIFLLSKKTILYFISLLTGWFRNMNVTVYSTTSLIINNVRFYF